MGSLRITSLSVVLASLCCVCAAAHSNAQTPELIVEVESEQIYQGESVLYRVTLNHVDAPKPPELKGFDAFQIATLGEQSLNSRQITIINGQKSEIVRQGRQYNYRLTPLRSGTLTIPAPTVEIDGQTLTGREVKLTVVAPEEQDAVLVEFRSDRDAVYPLQPFELALTVAVRALPGQLSEQDPLSVQPRPPALSVTWLDDEQLPDGMQPQKSWREILEPMISRRGNGFQVNNIGTSSVFSLFQNDAAGFHPTPRRTTRKNSAGEEVEYWEYRFSRVLIPQKIGKYDFPAVSLKGTFADEIQNGRLTGRQIYALAPGLTITVRDVPLEGRPESYIGAVGKFEVTADLAPRSARVGDPMTLTITLNGQGTLDSARPPELTGLPGIEGAFRTYDATEESSANSRTFTYSLRPLETDVTQFPAIPVSYFDVEAEKYVTRSTDPISVTIAEAETLTDADIVSSPAPSATEAGGLQASEGGVFANDTRPEAVRNESVSASRYVGLWALMFVVWGMVSFGLRRARKIREDPALMRRRAAPARARAILNSADGLPAESLRRVVTGLIADFADVPAAGMTPRDAAELLQRWGVDETLCSRTDVFLNDCDAGRYGAAADVSDLNSEAAELLELLIGALRRTGSTHATSAALSASVLLAVLLPLSGCTASPDLEKSRQFQQIEQAFSRAVTSQEFAEVAHQYDVLCGPEFRSGAVLYNQGNAWMRAGKPGHAIASYRQAQRFRPRDPYLAANLQNALVAAGRGSSQVETGVAAYLFFWQDWLSYPEKYILVTCLLAAAVLCSLLSQTTRQTTLWHRLSVAFLVCAGFAGASTAWDWHRFEQSIHGVVIAGDVVARKGNSETYEAAFIDPLSEGTEFVVLEDRGDWINAQVGDAGTAWLPRAAVQVY